MKAQYGILPNLAFPLAYDELFILWKPTVLYLLCAAALLASQRFTATPIPQRLMGGQIPADTRTWRVANAARAALAYAVALAHAAWPPRRAAGSAGSS